MKVTSHSIVDKALFLLGCSPRLVFEHSLLIPAFPERVRLTDILIQQRISGKYLLHLLLLDFFEFLNLLASLFLLTFPFDFSIFSEQLQLVFILIVIIVAVF